MEHPGRPLVPPFAPGTQVDERTPAPQVMTSLPEDRDRDHSLTVSNPAERPVGPVAPAPLLPGHTHSPLKALPVRSLFRVGHCAGGQRY